jgi:lysophospholipase L1-like esterase
MRYWVCLALASVPCSIEAAEPFPLHNGDRVVLVGNTLIEREQQYGYWETALTVRFADCNITFRNLGWSGDTVWGEARAGFDTAKEGFERLVKQTLALKPTVIILGYGSNESFAGEAGLARFEKQLNKLLDALAESRARFVILAPLMFEEKTWRAGHYAERKRDLKLYTEAIRRIARERKAHFADEIGERFPSPACLTNNGMHLTAFGYSRTETNLVSELGLLWSWRLKTIELAGNTSSKVQDRFLPDSPVPPEPGVGDVQGDSFVRARDLKPGRHTLYIDGRPVQTEDAEAWMKKDGLGVQVLKGPSLDQVEQLRRAIVEKNRLYFYRWRPQNETYLFGFRKHEQGQNAREMPLFDPLVAEKEAEIARLRVPVEHVYELKPAEEGKR